MMKNARKLAVVSTCAVAAWVAMAGQQGNALEAEAKLPAGVESLWAGQEPVFEVWHEEIVGRCTLGVAMDGSVLLFKDTQEPDFVWVKRSEDGGKTWGERIKVGKRVEIEEDMTDGGRYKKYKDVQWSRLGTHVVDEKADVYHE